MSLKTITIDSACMGTVERVRIFENGAEVYDSDAQADPIESLSELIDGAGDLEPDREDDELPSDEALIEFFFAQMK